MYVLSTMACYIFCVYHSSSECVNVHTYIITALEEMEIGKVFCAHVLTLASV